jgi:hypothetical protein
VGTPYHSVCPANFFIPLNDNELMAAKLAAKSRLINLKG